MHTHAGVVVVDGLLTPEALEGMRRWCREASTVSSNYIQGYQVGGSVRAWVWTA
jgi:hypothetical protein